MGDWVNGLFAARKTEQRGAFDWIMVLPWIAFALSALVAWLSVQPPQIHQPSASNPAAAAQALSTGVLVALCALVGVMIVWFVRAFTFSLSAASDALRELYRRHIFIFAYAFTFISFVVVTMPAPDLFRIDEKSEKLTPISMFYGCFDYGGKYVEMPSPRCDSNDATPAKGDVARDRPAASPAPTKGPNTPNGASRTNAARAVAARTKTADEAGTARRAAEDQARADAAASNAAAASAKHERSYVLLLALGGSARQWRYTAGEDGPAGKAQPVYTVSGGLVMPLYIVLVAMIGGAISLSRRIPEIQKRSEPDFPGTSDQTRLILCEAREQVVFQIMQLIAAPFIAICSFAMFEPKSTPTAIALAFGSGFASETILLMIRGIVEGLRPGIPKAVASTNANGPASGAQAAVTTLTGRVVGKNSAGIADAVVWIEGSTATTRSDPTGAFTLDHVPLGSVTLHGRTSDQTCEGTLAIVVPAHLPITLILS